MKVIDLINMANNGEEMPKKIRVAGWTYRFEWVEHLSNYYDKYEDIDLMSALSMESDELEREVEIIQEQKKIPEKLNVEKDGEGRIDGIYMSRQEINERNTINSIIDYLKSKGE